MSGTFFHGSGHAPFPKSQRRSGKARTEIALEDILDLDDVLISHALNKGTDRKHASVCATGCRRIIQYAQSRGWSCDAVVVRLAWEPVAQAVADAKDGAVQLIRFPIVTRKTPASTTEADLQSWHARATDKEHGMLPATADRILVRFRSRMRLAKLDHLLPHLDLTSKKPSSYRTPLEPRPEKQSSDRTSLAETSPNIRAQIDELVSYRAGEWVPGRAARKALSPSSIPTS